MGGHEEGPQHSGGVRVFSIGGRMVYERERLLGMTDEERRWRAQFLKDQVLAENEPRFVPELFKATNNIFVRLFRIPMNMVEKAVTPILGARRACAFRYASGRFCFIYFISLCVVYYNKYNLQDWTRFGGWRQIVTREKQIPGQSGFPTIIKKENHEYADYGFSTTHFW